MSRAVRLGIASLAIWVVTPVAAQAAQRFVAPAGTGTACTQTAPCLIGQGINAAGAGDEVIVGPGTYSLAAPLTSSAGLNVHGAAGQPRPVIVSSAASALALFAIPSRVADLEVHHSGPFTGVALFANGSTLERVVSRTSGFTGCAAGPTAVVRDSVCVSTGNSGNGFELRYGASGGTSTLKVRNLTAVGTGAGSAGFATSIESGSGTLNVDARGVIAQGVMDDVRALAAGFTANNHIVLDHSNYDDVSPAVSTASVTPPGTGTNQTAAPIFADTALYHQASGSPTVDAGATDADSGSTDLDGDARILGAAPDIGADEFVPPPGDTTAPQTTIHKRPIPRTARRRATFTFTSSEPASTFECRLDKHAFAACTSPVRKRVARRKHTFAVRAIDAVGNVDATPDRYKWKVKKKRKRRR